MGSNNDLVGSLIDNFFSQAGMQKQAADSTNPQGAGSEALKEKKTGTEIKEIDADNTLSAETDRGAEMEADLKDSEIGATKGNAQLATEDGAKTKEEEEVVHPQDNPQSPQQVNADESIKMEGDNVKVTDVTTAHAAPSEISKVARSERLSTALLQTIAQLSFEEPINKEAAAVDPTAAPAPAAKAAQEPSVQKEAGQDDGIDEDVFNSFLAYSAGFERGLQKKAEDINDVVASGVVPDEGQAAALLDATAVQNPEAVLPEEAQPEADMSPEDAAALEELAGELDAAGISPEELMEAQAQVEAIKAETGATDEEIIQVLQEEAGGMGAEAPVDAAMEAPEAPMEAPVEAPVEVPAEEEIPKVASAKTDSRKDNLLATLHKMRSEQ